MIQYEEVKHWKQLAIGKRVRVRWPSAAGLGGQAEWGWREGVVTEAPGRRVTISLSMSDGTPSKFEFSQTDMIEVEKEELRRF